MPNSSSFGTPESEMPDGGWPIFDLLSLRHSIHDYARLWQHGQDHPEDVIIKRIPEIEQHIIERAFDLGLPNELPTALRARATGRILNLKMSDIAKMAEEMVQLARETGSSSEGGAG